VALATLTTDRARIRKAGLEYNYVMEVFGWSDHQVDELLKAAGLEPGAVQQVLNAALEEDLRYGPDVTTEATIDADAEAVAEVVARQAGTVAGLPVAAAVIAAMGLPLGAVTIKHRDGEEVAKDDVVMVIKGPLRKILSAERTLVNFITHLSGIATHTRRWVDAVAGTDCQVRDTRKTTPGLRELEKYAVRCGGGRNHRMGLGDAALIKDNHVLGAGSVSAAIAAVQKADPNIPLEVECDTIPQVKEALAMKVKLILLDNMSLSDIKAAVALGKDYSETRFEASGGLRLETASAVAETGVDYIAVGALTHSSPAVDFALDIRK
jgi:nicotinate-nucleotide pyrophosphorylase (carboxylating)